MIVRWGLFKLSVDKRDIDEGKYHDVVVCRCCGKILTNPLKPIFANETGFAYCSEVCAKQDVMEVAERMRAEDPDWKGF